MVRVNLKCSRKVRNAVVELIHSLVYAAPQIVGIGVNWVECDKLVAIGNGLRERVEGECYISKATLFGIGRSAKEKRLIM